MAEVESIKTAPHSVEAEQAVLGSFLISGTVDDQNAFVMERLMALDFYLRAHQLIFAVMLKLAEKDNPLDALLLTEKLRERGELDEIGGPAYLAELAENTPEAINIEAYSNIVVQHSIKRQLLQTAGRISASVYAAGGKDVDALVDHAESLIFSVKDGRSTQQSGPQAMAALLSQAEAKIEELYEAKGALTGVTTGFKDIDKLTNGLQPADLIVIAGRPSMGKTSLAANMVEAIILQDNPLPALFFSLEMPSVTLMVRLLASMSSVNQQTLRSGQISQEHKARLISSITSLKDKPLLIDDTFTLTPMDLRARARRVVREYGKIGIIIIDYLQLMQGSAKGREENRATEISEISRSLKALAKEVNCPVVALSQLNRGVEQRPNKRPMMSDLRESGAIEQDADLIMFIYRDEVYNEESESKGIAEIIIGKQRNGPIGTCKLTFLPELTRFEDSERGSYEGV